ncbi:Uncharacterised protein [Actinobacillus pleuropneumoniae]|nr:Uncharacterised protein [Actinobacillus pleuropneumoniae]
MTIIGQRPDQGQLLVLGGIQRQQSAAILQEHDRFPGAVPGLGQMRRWNGSPFRQISGFFAFFHYIRVLEQSEADFHPQNAKHRIIQQLKQLGVIQDQRLQMIEIDAGMHVHVDAGVQPLPCGILPVLRIAMVDQLFDRLPVADHHAVKAPLPLQYIPQQIAAPGSGNPVEFAESTHHRQSACPNPVLERRQHGFPQRPLRHVRRIIVPAAFNPAITGKMLHACRYGRVAVPVRTLKSSYLRGSGQGGQIGILSRTLRDPAPPGVARHVHHRGKSPADAFRCRLLRRNAGVLLHPFEIPAGGFAERNRKDGAKTVNDVIPDKKRNPQPRFLHGQPLELVDLFRTMHIQQRPDLAFGHHLQLPLLAPAVLHRLTDLLGQSHLREQVLCTLFHVIHV